MSSIDRKRYRKRPLGIETICRENRVGSRSDMEQPVSGHPTATENPTVTKTPPAVEKPSIKGPPPAPPLLPPPRPAFSNLSGTRAAGRTDSREELTRISGPYKTSHASNASHLMEPTSQNLSRPVEVIKHRDFSMRTGCPYPSMNPWRETLARRRHQDSYPDSEASNASFNRAPGSPLYRSDPSDSQRTGHEESAKIYPHFPSCP